MAKLLKSIRKQLGSSSVKLSSLSKAITIFNLIDRPSYQKVQNHTVNTPMVQEPYAIIWFALHTT